MSKHWESNDSARTMTNKFNAVVDIVDGLQKGSVEINDVVKGELLDLEDKLKTKAGKDKKDVGLGEVDNTSDMDKPVSTAQARAIDLATEDKLTSIPAYDIFGQSDLPQI